MAGRGAADGRGGKATGGPFRTKMPTDSPGVFARGVPPGHHWPNDALGALLERQPLCFESAPTAAAAAAAAAAEY